MKTQIKIRSFLIQKKNFFNFGNYFSILENSVPISLNGRFYFQNREYFSKMEEYFFKMKKHFPKRKNIFQNGRIFSKMEEYFSYWKNIFQNERLFFHFRKIQNFYFSPRFG
jgi:hypothetical protein